MKLFASVNKKIKFREKDYVERNYIREDGKAVIPDGKTDHHDTGMFFRWGSILHVL